jgi:hypothetical protein
MSRQLERKLDAFIKQTDERLDGIEQVLIKQEINLSTHMKRSEHLENLMEHIQQQELNPIKKHIHMVEGGLKMVGGLSIISGFLALILKFLGV